jgi:hypothetical protein
MLSGGGQDTSHWRKEDISYCSIGWGLLLPSDCGIMEEYLQMRKALVNPMQYLEKLMI